MKKLIIVAVALFTLNISAAEPVKTSDSLRAEIINLLGDNLSFDTNSSEMTVEIIFSVNSRGELVIISTNALDKSTETLIKQKLNYKKVDFKSDELGEMYLLPLTIRNS